MQRGQPRPYLIDRMRDRAAADRLPADHPVCIFAEKAEAVVTAHGSSALDVKRAIQQARVAWHQYSREPIYD